MLLTCVACSAMWERHGAWTGRIREPDRERLLAARQHGSALTPAEPLPMVQSAPDARSPATALSQ
jgi:hypothetical protein